LIFDYSYDKLSALIRSRDWSTEIFPFEIGLFQGCALSCILFNCVFQLLLNLLQPLSKKCGYSFKDSAISLHDQAFADDISICSSTPELNQLSINQLVCFLKWAHMQANPKKCICFASKKFDPRFVPKVEFERYGTTVYCPYDPMLTINGEKLRFIVNVAADPNSLQFDHFKELGRWISVNLTENQVCGVNGLHKLFLYEHFIVRRLSWPFLVHDLCLSYARDLDKFVIPHLKRWAGLYRSSDVGTLFRLRSHLGLQLT